MAGAYADQVYNEEGFLEDMIGDKVYESANDEEGRLKLIGELRTVANHSAWINVLDKFSAQNWD